MVLGLDAGLMRKSTDGKGGFSRSPADSKNVVLGGAESGSGSPFSVSPFVALARPFIGEDGGFENDDDEDELLSIRNVWLRL
jgi:hypothetical protein